MTTIELEAVHDARDLRAALEELRSGDRVRVVSARKAPERPLIVRFGHRPLSPVVKLVGSRGGTYAIYSPPGEDERPLIHRYDPERGAVAFGPNGDDRLMALEVV